MENRRFSFDNQTRKETNFDGQSSVNQRLELLVRLLGHRLTLPSFRRYKKGITIKMGLILGKD